MLSLKNKKSFPKMVFLGEGILKNQNHQSNTSLYRLDWTKHDETVKKKFEDWVKNRYPNVTPEYTPFPEEYDKWLDGLQFSISRSYMAEIKRMTQMALLELNVDRPFDLGIRDRCLEPAVSFVFATFMLVADCIYDPKTQWFERSIRNSIARHIMAYKFWYRQTNDNNLYSYARVRDLGCDIDDEVLRGDEATEAENWIKTVDVHVGKVKEVYDRITGKKV